MAVDAVGLRKTESFIGEEEEGAVPAVVKLRDVDWAGEIAAVFVPLVYGSRQRASKEFARGGSFGAVELQNFSVKLVGATLADDDNLGWLIELRRGPVCEDFELRDCVSLGNLPFATLQGDFLVSNAVERRSDTP